MAEVKNAFIKSKMNKDLDDRLLPPGEYREGLNIQVSKSEGEDVGALENALGNSKALISSSGSSPTPVDFSVLAGLSSGTLKSIGVYGDVTTSTIFVFLTDYTDPAFPGNESYSASANNYIYSYNTLTRSVSKIASGAFLNFSTTNPVHGTNLLENLLFWTDNRNQPRKINIDLTGDGSYYNSEDKISVAKYNPYEVIQLYYLDNEPNDKAGNVNPNYGEYVCAAQDVTSENLPDGTTSNMYFDNNWPGDPDFLRNKFVSFSYRFKFTDGEYSILAPFTQEAFISEQDGYFLEGDEQAAYRSTIVEFMRNKVDNVKLSIPLPMTGGNLQSELGVDEIEVVYKESDSLAVKVLDSIPSSSFSTSVTNTYVYDYQSRKPFKTLPESEIVRVYDKVPVKALGQEIISNRVVYSNFQDKHTPPATINYDVAATEKNNFSLNATNSSKNTTSQVEYPEHTLKQNRNYQVGIVLSDRYGRQSTTILSPVSSINTTVTVAGEDVTFNGSTFYHPYRSEPNVGENIVNSWSGDSLKLLVNAGINSVKNTITGTPGLYNGDTNSSEYNPLGWYSYKVVVKQTETDYYNVYSPGILNDYPDYKSTERTDAPDPQGTIAHISLISDNINKVPRDLTEVGPEQTQYRSDVKLFGRVTPNFILDTTPTFNEPYYPGTNTMTVVAIAEQDNMFTDANRAAPYNTVYQTDSDPYIARISQNNVGVAPLPPPIGSSSINQISNAYNIILGVFETAPFESLLDIFYETSTTGLVSDFNEIAAENSDLLAGWTTNGQQGFIFTQSEKNVGGDIVVANFTAASQGPFGLIPVQSTDITLTSVIDGYGNIITSNWILENGQSSGNPPSNTYNLKVVNSLYHEVDPLLNTFTFTFNVINLTDANNPVEYGNIDIPGIVLANIAPTIIDSEGNDFQPSDFPAIESDRTDPNIPVFTFLAKNGAAESLDTAKDLTWSISNQVPATPELTINATDGELFAPLEASGSFDFDITVRDSGNDTDVVRIGAVAGKIPFNYSFGQGKNVEISKGLESVAAFWCDDYASALSASWPNSYNIARKAGFNTTEVNIIPESKVIPINAIDSEGRNYWYRNDNIIPSSTFGSTNALTKGTAFIKVDFNFQQWLYRTLAEVDSVDIFGQQTITWTAYLQRRENTDSEWSFAMDIEGRQIRFGGEYQNLRSTNSNSDFFSTGILTNPSSFNISSQLDSSRRPAEDSLGVSGEFPRENGIPTATQGTKIFAFGLDQSYNETPSQYGEYRLLILYPQNGTYFGEGYGDNSFPREIVPTPINSDMDEFSPYAVNGATDTEKKINVKITYGDFYYPPFAEEVKSYAYKVGSSGRSNSAEVTSYSDAGITVFAEEWALKYVTQFYEDPDLKIKWTPSSYSPTSNWYGYRASWQNNDLPQSSNYEQGTENASFQIIVNQNNISASSTNGGQGDAIRTWAAQFDSEGKKIKGTAVPILSSLLQN